jgi:drug/metabolite transporter (DMT)-like permease
VLGLALICSAFGLIMQPMDQKFTTAEHTGLLLSLEPVFSALFAYLFAGEVFTLQQLFGAAL